LHSPAVAHAETRRITLDEAVALATKQNSIVKLAHLKEKEMRARVTEARANYFPVLSNDSDAAHLRSIEHMEIPMGALAYTRSRPCAWSKCFAPLGHHDFLLSTTTAAQPITQYSRFTPE